MAQHTTMYATKHTLLRLLLLPGSIALAASLVTVPARTVLAQPAAGPAPGGIKAPGQPNTGQRNTAPKPVAMLVDRVVATVNDEIILNSELRMRVAPLAFNLSKIQDLSERSRRLSKLTSQVLGEMINETLVTQAAATAKLAVGSKEVDSAITDLKRQNHLDDDQLKVALRMQGYSMSSYRKDVRSQIVRMRAVNTLVRPKVSISDDDVKAKYDSNARRSADVSEVHLQHIMLALAPNPTHEQRRALRDKASSILVRAQNGEDFAKLAEQYSDDPSTKNTGGDLGWIERGTIASDWEIIVFAMAKGETRGPVDGPRGLHIFHVSEVKQSKHEGFEAVKEKLRNALYRTELDKQTRLWIDDLRKKAHFEIKL